MALSAAAVTADGGVVELQWQDGTQARFHAVWLRDNALDAATRDPGNGQRLIALSDIAAEERIAHAELVANGVHLQFSSGHETAFPGQWLKAHRYDRAAAKKTWAGDIRLWTRELDIHSATLPDLQGDSSALQAWLTAVRRDGVALVDGLAPHSGSLADIVALFGYIRETNYGRWFDVRSEVNPTNLAYTNQGLQAHTDNPYRDPVPGLQVLACLENSVEGGESSVVDGFAAAEHLRQQDPRAFDVLCRYPAQFEYAGASGVRLQARRPILECGPDGRVLTLRFNNRSLGAVTDIPFEDMRDWYDALRALGEIIDDPDHAVTFRLEPGQAFIVDNTRVLHARAAYSSGGTRWIQGCYADRDGLFSTLSALEAQ